MSDDEVPVEAADAAELWVVVIDAFDPAEGQRVVLGVYGPESQDSVRTAADWATKWTAGPSFAETYPGFNSPGVELAVLQDSGELTGMRRNNARFRVLRAVREAEGAQVAKMHQARQAVVEDVDPPVTELWQAQSEERP